MSPSKESKGKERKRTIILSDPHPIFRNGLRAIIEQKTPHRVVAEAGDGKESIELVQKHRPDMMIMAIDMPVLNGLEVSKHVLRRRPDMKIMVLSIHGDRHTVSQAIRNGVSGYLLKDDGAHVLLDAMEKIFNGQRYISSSLADVVAEIIISMDIPVIRDYGLEKLSLREIQILSMSACRVTKSEIAKRLNISPGTVKTHRANIKTKLKLKDWSEIGKTTLEHFLHPIP
ncbi:MAG: response regulator transcription factor [Candidatus Aureabacteria bacterium]|nr:response regulator transcription factor [Candidatus Auribacterota bacterium]